ncbi:MAG: hypothetical protein JSV42_00405 [Chloroflexota bacterium]|nr:MAG: hypothetical protein JSV42_00405 [Chloroflexota bacterium]
MLDDFRNDANASPYFEDESEAYFEEVPQKKSRGKILGMTAAQRLVIAIMLFLMTCIVGTLMLLVFERIVPF